MSEDLVRRVADALLMECVGDFDGLDRERLAKAAIAECWKEVNAMIVHGPLPGNGTDKTAQRNGLVLAANALFVGSP